MLAGVAVAGAARPKAKSQLLAAGQYSAQVKALVCGACAPKVLETLKAFPGIEKASVDSDKSRVSFNVKAGSKVSLAKLQAIEPVAG